MNAASVAELSNCDSGLIEVWQADLLAGSPAERRYREVLSDEELRQAGRYHFADDRRRFVLRRAFRRQVLASRLQLAPERLQFETGFHGKPALAGSPGSIHFNSSASGEIALLAVDREGGVGVDVERHRPLGPDGLGIIGLFSAAEQAALARLTAPERAAAFFDCWTRKEAFVKALGLGLTLPLNQFTVRVDPGVPAALLHFAGDPEAARRWNLTALDVGPGYSAALAVDRPSRVLLRPWSWPG